MLLFGKQCSKCLLFCWYCLVSNAQNTYCSIIAVVDPGFPVGGHRPIGGHRPPTCMFFGKNMQKWKNWILLGGGGARRRPPGSANVLFGKQFSKYLLFDYCLTNNAQTKSILLFYFTNNAQNVFLCQIYL